MKDVTATYTKAIGKHGKKETSNENYAQNLRKQFSNLMDRPKWANLELQKESEDSDDEFFRETTDTLATGKAISLKDQCPNEEKHACNMYPNDDYRNYHAQRSYIDVCNDNR